MEKVTNIEKIPVSSDEKRIFGNYARKKCEVTLQDGSGFKIVECYMDQEKINEFITSFNHYLNDLLTKRSEQKANARKQKNMKNSFYYAIGVVGLVAAFLASTPTGVPFYIAAALVGIIPAVVTNIDLFKPFDSSPEIKEIKDKLAELENLAEEAKTEQSNYNANENRRLREATLNQDKLANSKIIGIEELKQRVRNKTSWNARRLELQNARMKANRRIYALINNMDEQSEYYNEQIDNLFRR